MYLPFLVERNEVRMMERLFFITININGEFRQWHMTLNNLREEYYGNCDLPSLDDRVTQFEMNELPMYFNTFSDIIKTFGIDNRY